MTPYRTETLAGYAAGNLRSLAQAPVDSTGAATAGLVALIGWAFGSANTGLLIVVGAAMVLDLIAGAVGAIRDPKRRFCAKKLYGGFVGKLFRVLLAPAASLIDWLLIASPLPLPDGYAAAFPVTAFALVGLAAAELTSVLNKLKAGGVAPSLIAVLLRTVNRAQAAAEPAVLNDQPGGKADA